MDKIINELENKAFNTRKRVLKLTIDLDGGYLGQACSSSQTLSALYNNLMNLSASEAPMIPHQFPGVPNPNNMDFVKGSAYHGSLEAPYDRFFFSPAHYAAVVYASLIEAGRIDENAMTSFNVDGSSLEMIGAEHSPGFECSAGSLAQAISVAQGVAHAKKMRNEPGRVFVYLSDGELQEGQLWEAIQASAMYKLDNLIIYVDVNGQQLDGLTKNVMNIEPIDERFKAFGATAIKINGHNMNEIVDSINHLEKEKPLVVLCYTDSSFSIPLLEQRKPYLHYVRFKSNDEKKMFQEFYDQYKLEVN